MHLGIRCRLCFSTACLCKRFSDVWQFYEVCTWLGGTSGRMSIPRIVSDISFQLAWKSINAWGTTSLEKVPRNDASPRIPLHQLECRFFTKGSFFCLAWIIIKRVSSTKQTKPFKILPIISQGRLFYAVKSGEKRSDRGEGMALRTGWNKRKLCSEYLTFQKTNKLFHLRRLKKTFVCTFHVGNGSFETFKIYWSRRYLKHFKAFFISEMAATKIS